MLTEVHGAQTHDPVHMVGRGNADDIDGLTAVLQHLPPIGVGFGSWIIHLQFFGWAGIHIGGCYELHFRMASQRLDVRGPPSTDAHGGILQFLHG